MLETLKSLIKRGRSPSPPSPAPSASVADESEKSFRLLDQVSDEVNRWMESEPTPTQIKARLAVAEHDAFLWHVLTVAGRISPETQREVERIAADMHAAGYRG